MSEGKRKILIVDDDQSLLEAYAAFLKTEYEVYTSDTVEKAKEFVLHNQDIDLILLDMSFPGEDRANETGGLVFADFLNGMGVDIPFIVFTGNASVDNYRDSSYRGCIEYINKSTEDVAVLLNEAIAGHMRSLEK